MLVQLSVGWEQLLLLFLISTYIIHNYFAKWKLLLLFCLIFDIIKSLLPSSSGLGHWPLTPATWVRISLGVPIQSTTRLIFFNFNFILKNHNTLSLSNIVFAIKNATKFILVVLLLFCSKAFNWIFFAGNFAWYASTNKS